MVAYRLNRLVKGRRPGTTAQLPKIEASLATEAEYLKALRAALRSLVRAIRDDVLPVVERELAQRSAELRVTQDVDPGTFERVSALAGALTRMTTNTVMRILGLESERHSAKFMQSAKRALGIDLQAVVRQEDLGDLLETAATRNAGLIKGLLDTTVTRVQTTVTNAVLSGTPVKDLKKRLARDFKFGDARARLIARDQTAKLNADLNEFRHRQAGIVKYHWRTSADERVRPRHRDLEGKTYEYGKPTGAEEGLPPGKPIQCRCIAQAIVEF